MEAGMSTMLIEDIVLPDQDVTQKDAEMDLLMMLLFGGSERTLKLWRDLIESVTPALEIVKVWKTDEDFQAVLEIRLRQ